MGRRASILVLGLGVALLIAAALRYRHENEAATGHGVLTTPTTLDLYGGADADHTWSVGITVVGVLAVTAGGISWMRGRPTTP